MKTYIHPDIVLPAGTVKVEFYDYDAATATENMPNVIKAVGDVEEGFGFGIGEFWASDCSFTFWNKDNYVLGTLLNTLSLGVKVLVDNELYFIGDIDINSVDPNVHEFTSGNVIGEIRVDAVHRFASLTENKISDLYGFLAPLSDPTTGHITLATIMKYIAAHIGAKSANKTDIEYIDAREFYAIGQTNKHQLDDLVFKSDYFQVVTSNNNYAARIKNEFELLSELTKELFFYPSLYWDGTDLILSIYEKDIQRTVTPGDIKFTKPSNKYALQKLIVELDNMPDNFNKSGLSFEAVTNYPHINDNLELKMHITNIDRTDGSWNTNMILYLPNDAFNGITAIDYVSNVYPGYNAYTSLQEAIYYAYKKKYYDYNKWRKVITRGLKATYNSVSSMKYLMPGYRFSLFGQTHYIHSVKKSLMRNESEVEALILI